jgi:hypothetical protein
VSSVSGLSKANRTRARDRCSQAAWLAYNHKGAVHYTQGARRWEGIRRELNARTGRYPGYCDCSSFATWCLWNGLYLGFGCRDTVNGTAWKAGYTGTMLNHGKPVQHLENVLRSDCVIYGRAGTNGAHTAIVVSFKGATPYVISHGSEAGPFFVPYNYRKDIIQIRRYI